MQYLLIIPAVKVTQLSHQPRVDETIGRNEMIRHGCLAMIHMSQDAQVPNAVLHAPHMVLHI